MSRPLRWAAAPLAVAVSAGLQAVLLPEPSFAPFALLSLSVAVAAWAGGRAPGLAATALSGAVANYWFMEPPGSWHLTGPGLAALLLYLAAASAVALLCGSLRAAVLEADERARVLRALASQLPGGLRGRDPSGRPVLGDEQLDRLRRYELLAEHTREIILFVDRHDGRIVDANPAAAEAYGWTREELLQRRIHDLRIPSERAKAPGQFAQADTRGIRFETVHRRADGTEMPVEVSSRGADLGDRRVLVSIVRDLTDRRRAEEHLRRRETILAQAGQMAHLGAWEIEVSESERLEESRLVWSDEVYRIFGYEPGAVAVTSALFFERVHPDDRARVAQEVAQAIAERGPYEVEHRVVRPDGSERVVEERAEIVFDGAGRLVRILGAVQDVTERREAEQALRERERDLNRAQAVAHVGSWRLDVRRDRVTWSDETYRIFGIPKGTPIPYGRFLAAVHPEDRAEVDRCWRAALGGAPYDLEHRIVADGAVKWVRQRAELERDATGAPRSAFGTVQDVTEQRRAEQALREANERLAEADRRKDEFLAMLSHELRNPLAPVRNSLEVLRRADPASDKAARARAVMERQVRHLSRLVDELLDVTRVTRGKIRLQREPVELGTLVRHAVDAQRPVFEALGVALELEPPGAPLPAHADPTRVEQIVGNLLSNAAKFTPPGGRATVRVESEPGWALVRVSDNGAGIAREVLPRLFAPFVQADTTLDRSRGGLGLGLALVRGLAELHGGSVQARSAGPGLGAEFVVRLPLATPAPPPEEEARAPDRPAAGPAPSATNV